MTYQELVPVVMRWLTELNHDPDETIELDTDLLLLDALDSLAFIEVLTLAEEELGVYVPETAAADNALSTPDKIIRVILSYATERK